MACENLLKKCKAECCGIVPIPKETWEKHQDKINRKPVQLMFEEGVVFPITIDAVCPFLSNEHRCNIYEDRPDVCAMFSNEEHPMLTCKYIDKTGKERSRQDKRRVNIMIEKFVIAFGRRKDE